jgi:hypothetical protein
MKYLFFIAFVLFSTNSFANEIDVKISLDHNHKKGMWVSLRLHNTTNDIACLSAKYAGLNGYIGAPVFHVKRNGTTLDFNSASDDDDGRVGGRVLIKLLPKSSVTTTVNLSDMYDFSKPGDYEIQYGYTSTELCPNLTAFFMKSNTLLIKNPSAGKTSRSDK